MNIPNPIDSINNIFSSLFKKEERKKITVKCKKSIYKSTYKKNAFTKGKDYIIDTEDTEYIYVFDSNNHSFSMRKDDKLGFYKFDDYFIMNK